MHFKTTLIAALLCLIASGCAELDYPYDPSPYNSYSDPYDYRRDDYYRDRERDRLNRERRDIERERDRLEDERRRNERDRYRPAPPVYQPPQQREERCPSGFSPSENKCSAEERRRGCKDMRLPGGLGCVRR